MNYYCIVCGCTDAEKGGLHGPPELQILHLGTKKFSICKKCLKDYKIEYIPERCTCGTEKQGRYCYNCGGEYTTNPIWIAINKETEIDKIIYKESMI